MLVPGGIERQGFRRPDFAAPIDLGDRLARVPDDAWVKGAFAQRVLKLAEEGDLIIEGFGPYAPYRNVPLREFMQLVWQGAEQFFPHCSKREGLRRLGALFFEHFLDSLTGKVIFGVIGRTVPAVAAASARAYAVTQSHGRCVIEAEGESEILLRYTDLYQFLDCLEVGVIEAALEFCGVHGEVLLKLDSVHSGRVLIRWWDTAAELVTGETVPI